MDDPLRAVTAIASSGLRAQGERMRTVAENVANAFSTGTTPNEDPYRRKMVSFETTVDQDTGAAIVQVGEISRDESSFSIRYEPSHPAADENGFVKYPNVNPLIEMSNLREASRSYEANLTMLTNAREMRRALVDLLR
jgi:flagellar basal-body rod protein FlgC